MPAKSKVVAGEEDEALEVVAVMGMRISGREAGWKGK
jgi:hypothetical protein